jgi:hypothetical protein
MALEALISEIEAAQAATGYPGYTTTETRVTSADRAIPDGYMGYAGYTSIGISGNAVKPSGELALSNADEEVIVVFDEWRLPSGRRVAFKLAIPKEKYDGFELLRLLEK